MSRTIEVSDEVYQRVAEEASASGTTPAGWVEAQLRPPAPNGSTVGAPALTLADEFAGRVGLISTGRSNLSERVSELFAGGMAEKHALEVIP